MHTSPFPSKPEPPPSSQGSRRRRLLVIDNYDSFTFNLVQMFRKFPLGVRVLRSDATTVTEVQRDSPDYIVISPGPKDPRSAGISVELIQAVHHRIPILGVCLGMQCINEAFGGKTIRAPLPIHGKTSQVEHEGEGLFRGVANPFRVARYHSLCITAPSDELRVTAHSEDQVPMAIAHRTSPLFGVQFHPESFLTEHGFVLIENFLNQSAQGMAAQ